MRKCREVAVLRKVKSQGSGDLFHRFDLRRTADATDRVPTLIAGRTPEWKSLIQEISDHRYRNDVRRNVGRDVARLRFIPAVRETTAT